MEIAVLGAGPSGMMAAHAVSQCGHKVDIFDKDPDVSRRNSGVYFLHKDCDLLLKPTTIDQGVLGAYGKSPSEVAVLYGLKVYGREVAKVSIIEAMKTSSIVGYNSEEAITRLWDLYGKRVQKDEIAGANHVLKLLAIYDKVISTIPAYILYPELKYDSVKTWIKVGKAPSSEAFLFYNINPYCDWYRCSAMFGVFIQEYGFNQKPRETAPSLDHKNNYEYKEVVKVIGDGLSSGHSNILLTGRYGAWNKKMLTHDVYYQTLKWLGA